jgi:hypothetical protein
MREFAGWMSIQLGAASLQRVNEGYSGGGLPAPRIAALARSQFDSNTDCRSGASSSRSTHASSVATSAEKMR